MTESRFPRASTLLFGLLAALVATLPATPGPGSKDEPGPVREEVKSLLEGEPDLRTAFNQDPDKVRMVLILSPT